MGELVAAPWRATVASLDEARVAIRAAIERGLAAELESPPDAALIHGVLWFSEMQRALKVEFPHARFRLILDCADRADLAHAALIEGLPAIRLGGHPAAIAAIADIARQLGAELIAGG